jgi:hypothetical protein
MDSMRSVQSTGSGAAVRTAQAPAHEPVRAVNPGAAKTQQGARSSSSLKPVGYGLPCVKCRKYYSASLNACPVCQTSQRVSPIAALPCAPVEPQPAGKELDDQKERFLREFKAKLYAAHMQISSTSHRCSYAGEDDAGHDSAAVCKVCYERLQARMDLLESALEMDLKEAAQIIYDAVWADTSDSNRTYMNAAKALLGKLRKRAGMATSLGRIQPLSH